MVSVLTFYSNNNSSNTAEVNKKSANAPFKNNNLPFQAGIWCLVLHRYGNVWLLSNIGGNDARALP